MKRNTLIQLTTISLCLLLLFPLSSCKREKGEDSTSAKKTASAPAVRDAAELGVETFGSISPKDLPHNTELTQWYGASASREQLTNAILYAYDTEEDCWYCWLWVGECSKDITLSIRVRESDGTLLLWCNGTETDSGEAEGYLTCFAVPGSSEPVFELYCEGEYSGLILTRATSAIQPH